MNTLSDSNRATKRLEQTAWAQRNKAENFGYSVSMLLRTNEPTKKKTKQIEKLLHWQREHSFDTQFMRFWMNKKEYS